MGPEGTCFLRWSAIGKALGLSHRGEQLGVEEFVPSSVQLGIHQCWLISRGKLDGPDVLIQVQVLVEQRHDTWKIR